MKDGPHLAPRECLHRRGWGLRLARRGAFVSGACALLLAAPAFASAGSLQQKLESIARGVPGTLGVAVLDLDRGTRVAIRGDEPAPMASVFKLPLAVAVLRRTQEQSIGLFTPVHVRWEERNPGWS